MNREEQLYSNIKLLTKLTSFFVFLLVICLIIDFFLPSKKEEEFSDESIEISESLGEIIEEKDPIKEKHFEKILSKNLIGTTSLNLNQSDNFTKNYNINKGLVAIDSNYITYSQYNYETESFDLILLNKNTNQKQYILKNSNPHFLHIYNGFVFGIYDINYKKDVQLDCVFLYNINKNIFTTYNKELGFNKTRNISSFITNGTTFFYTEYLNDAVYYLDVDGQKVKKLTDIEQQSMFDASILTDIKDNKLEIKTDYSKYFFNLKTEKIEKAPFDSFFPNCEFKGKEVKVFIDEIFNFVISLDNESIYTGNINAFNISDKIYFSDKNRLYSYDEEIKLIYEAPLEISQIYLFENDIILQLQGGTYEFYR